MTNISVFECLSPGRPSLGTMPHSHYFFRGGLHISLLCPPITCVCMCAGGYVTSLLVQDSVSTRFLLCLVTGNNANTDNSPISTSPLLYSSVSGMGDGRREIQIYLRYSHTFPTNRPTRNRARIASMIGQSITTRPPCRQLCM